MNYANAARLARGIALFTPLALLVGAYVSEYGFGLYPCEMCWWQRYAHFAALALAIAAWLRPAGWRLTALAGMAIALSAAIGLFHAGVEYQWWRGFTECTSYVSKGDNPLDAIMNAPMVRCDVAQWKLIGISLAGWNFLFSAAGALGITLLLGTRREAEA
jgi:disulfide bond formation protein DsbB